MNFSKNKDWNKDPPKCTFVYMIEFRKPRTKQLIISVVTPPFFFSYNLVYFSIKFLYNNEVFCRDCTGSTIVASLVLPIEILISSSN